MKRAFDYIDYEKISDDLMFIGNSTILRLNVVLAKPDSRDQTRRHFHKEYAYSTSKYSDKDVVVTMRRSFEYYLSIDKLDAREYSTMIRIQDIMLVRMKIHEVLNWFTSEVFGMKNNQLYIFKHPEPAVVSGLVENKSIIFEPVVITWDDGSQEQGVRMTLTDSNMYIDIPIGKFYGFAYIIDSINMFESAQLLVNYLGRPELGTNLCEFEQNAYLNDTKLPQKEVDIVAKERQIQSKERKKSFFDRMDDLG